MANDKVYRKMVGDVSLIIREVSSTMTGVKKLWVSYTCDKKNFSFGIFIDEGDKEYDKALAILSGGYIDIKAFTEYLYAYFLKAMFLKGETFRYTGKNGNMKDISYRMDGSVIIDGERYTDMDKAASFIMDDLEWYN